MWGMTTPLSRAVDLVGGQAALARLLNTRQQAVWNWLNRGDRVPAEFCPAIERVTRERGQVITCEDLRPDVEWQVLRTSATPTSSGAGTQSKASEAAAA
jgi:DNA-binding transcriptional regulator YdaS (Cro superfamily)